jgi:hypothetical protein
MLPEELEEEFQKLFTQIQPTDKEKNLLLLKAYLELSDRQWHTYELLPIHLSDEIDSVLINLWDKASIERTELLLGIVAYLGLLKTFEAIKSALDGELSAIVRQEILDAMSKFGNTIADPYSGNASDNS